MQNMAGSRAKFLSVDFEVFGRVQGVFFRKQYTHKNAVMHGLVGWVMNTKVNTVTGQIQGEDSKIQIMKTWLRTNGSPRSRIDKCIFTNERSIDKLDFTDFHIRK